MCETNVISLLTSTELCCYCFCSYWKLSQRNFGIFVAWVVVFSIFVYMNLFPLAPNYNIFSFLTDGDNVWHV